MWPELQEPLSTSVLPPRSTPLQRGVRICCAQPTADRSLAKPRVGGLRAVGGSEEPGFTYSY